MSDEAKTPLLSVDVKDMSSSPSVASAPIPHAPRLEIKINGTTPDELVFGHLKQVMRRRHNRDEGQGR
jgi:hypothetical protein